MGRWWRSGCAVVWLVAAAVLAACGSNADPTTANQPDAAPTESTDSLPGETASVATEPDESTTEATDGSGSGPEPGTTGSDQPATGDIGPGSGPQSDASITLGATRFLDRGFSDFSGRRIGLVASRASVVDGRSVIDLLAEHPDVDLVAIFTPEHGLRADGGAGELIDDEIDPRTGLPVFSLYGDTRQPTPDMVAGIDVLVFDLQDVGARYYTYTATMGLAMQAASRAGIPFVVLDRPNPLGGEAADGPLRAPDQVSFVSQYPTPSLHGLTSGELARAVKGERWLPDLDSLDLRVMALDGWSRSDRWPDTGLPWLAPSPGLPTVDAALAYPATVLFEATTLSYGRGTDRPFQQVGAPWLDGGALAETLNRQALAGVTFSPVSFVPTTDPPNGPPAANPQYDGVEVSGVRLEITDHRTVRPTAIGIHLLAAVLDQARAADQGVEVIDRAQFFDLLAGTPTVRSSLLADQDPAAIIASWDDDLARFDEIRARYLLY
jgi:uncharacterized protein YbbC (DUF1343 family)